jgi:integrase
MNVWKVTPADRDEQGKIKIGRSLADLLPASSGDTAQPAMPSKRSTAYTVGKTIFGYAKNWRKLMYNPFDNVDPPEVKTVEPVPLTAAEIAALRCAVEDHRLYVLYELSWTLGLRKGELLGLALDGLDLQAATITISQQVLDLDDGVSIEPYTKNNRVRILPLTTRLVALIKVRLEQLLAERGEAWQEHGLLFPSERGTPIYKIDLKVHLLRHTCLSWLGDTGASDMVIKAIAGHADRDVIDRYVHVSVAAMREAIVRMERAMIPQGSDEAGAAQEAAEVG